MDETFEAPPGGGGISGRIVAVAIVVLVTLAAVVGTIVLDLGATRALPGTPLTIRTDPPLPSGAACDLAGLVPARLVVRDGALVLVAAKDGATIDVVWPSGYAARLDQGRGELFDPKGYIVAAEGSVIQERLSGGLGADGAFHVCTVARD